MWRSFVIVESSHFCVKFELKLLISIQNYKFQPTVKFTASIFVRFQVEIELRLSKIDLVSRKFLESNDL